MFNKNGVVLLKTFQRGITVTQKFKCHQIARVFIALCENKTKALILFCAGHHFLPSCLGDIINSEKNVEEIK